MDVNKEKERTNERMIR